MSEIVIQENGSAPATPSSGNVTIYPKADGLMYSKDDAGTESLMSGSGSSAITSLTSDVTATGPGAAAATIANSAVTTAKINNDAVTFAKIQNSSGASKLLGRGSASGAGDFEEITLGSGLSLSGTSLSASGSGGTVTTTGSPANGNLAKFSGASSIVNGDLSGDVTTSGTLAATVAGTAQVDDGNSGTADTIDWGSLKFGRHKSTLTGNVTYTFSNPVAGGVYVLAVFTGAGSFSVTWPGTVKWVSAPTVTTTAARMDLFTFYYDGTNYYGTYAQNYTP